jgi:hypothetical protein
MNGVGRLRGILGVEQVLACGTQLWMGGPLTLRPKYPVTPLPCQPITTPTLTATHTLFTTTNVPSPPLANPSYKGGEGGSRIPMLGSIHSHASGSLSVLV